MTALALANSICDDLVQSVESWGDLNYIVMRYLYPDGDHVPIYVEPDGSVSDRGTTLHKLSLIGLDITSSRKSAIEAICNLYSVSFEDDTLYAPADNTGGTLLRLCEAIIRVSNMAYDHRTRRSITLGDQIDSILVERVAPHRAVNREWTSLGADPLGAYPVDFRVNGDGIPRHIFHVSNAQKGDTVSAVSNFLQLKEIAAPTLTIVSEHARLPEKSRSRLQMASAEIRFNGIDGNEDFLVDFALRRD